MNARHPTYFPYPRYPSTIHSSFPDDAPTDSQLAVLSSLFFLPEYRTSNLIDDLPHNFPSFNYLYESQDDM